ncbi:XdhC family protein [Pricia sp. S334]|uniref:XdhC family protein n=1 Tax=Pricia mediterranea TaxID=3076079 RepID=A0ABU3LBG1_9FLAO|nr:XdhC family protein [Pricia sp. S334]MDT7830412.1 XdhC family protein [Pricia sp. S334]
MTHELKKIVQAHKNAKARKLKTVLATVVALEGSSYRRPGVRMLIRDDGKTVGAVSGGCVEKEIVEQAQGVFSDGIPKMMTYDGRYRLGCEGILYILIEPFEPQSDFFTAFGNILLKRESFPATCYFSRSEGSKGSYGSVFSFDGKEFPVRPSFAADAKAERFEQRLQPCFKLIIIGAEHDAVQLCLFASLTGWEVTVVAGVSEGKEIQDFPGAARFVPLEPEMLPVTDIDEHTGVMVMTHSYVRDLAYLMTLRDARPAYLGLLGPASRRERLLGDFIERHPEVSDRFIDGIHGPAGLNIGAVTAQEIALAILAEILSVTRDHKPVMLKNKSGRIHNQ